ncbi:hypothetical protein ACI2L1_33525 [Streptomyces sp. NPDC019531]
MHEQGLAVDADLDLRMVGVDDHLPRGQDHEALRIGVEQQAAA